MELMKEFRELQKKQKAYQYVINVVSWDSSTEAPKEAFLHRAEMVSVLNKELFDLLINTRYQHVVNALYDQKDNLEHDVKVEISQAKKNLDKIVKIPKEEFVGYQKLIDLTQTIWEDAVTNDDYHSFKNNLEEIINYQKRFVNYYGYNGNPYNSLLDEYEEGYTVEDYDQFFDTLKQELVPFVKEVLTKGKKIREDFITDAYPKEKQKQFVEYLMDVLYFDKSKGVLKESVHPFTWNTHSKDVRITVRYLEDYFFSSIFAGIHELGHALYEQQIDSKYDMTNLNGGTSLGIHESQSRFYENIIGRSSAFWSVHYPVLQELFSEQLHDVSLDEFVLGINKVEASLIRVEADELTYSLHIMIRYEIEKRLLAGTLTVDELPTVWNQLYEEYLGITPPNDAMGVLQDVHWSCGLIGYFPTYALGSAYAAQFYYTMKKEMNIDQVIQQNQIDKINIWFKEHIHKYGKSKTPKELLLSVTNEPFNPIYYVQYLKEKYSKLYL